MGKIKIKYSIVTAVIKNAIDIMIPAYKSENMPKATSAINSKKFIKKIFKNRKDKEIIIYSIYNEVLNQNDIKKIDCKKIALKVVKSNNIENVLEKVLLTDYFTSNAVIKSLNEQSKKKLNNNKIKNKDINLLVKPVKNSGVRYKLT